MCLSLVPRSDRQCLGKKGLCVHGTNVVDLSNKSDCNVRTNKIKINCATTLGILQSSLELVFLFLSASICIVSCVSIKLYHFIHMRCDGFENTNDSKSTRVSV